MPSNSGLSRLAVSRSEITENLSKSGGDSLEPMPDALMELRLETLRTSHIIFTQDGGNRPVKIRQRGRSLASHSIGTGETYPVTGYFTLLRYLTNRTPQDMEAMLGFAPKNLAEGVDIMIIIDQLAVYQTAPRYKSAQTGIVSPGVAGTSGSGLVGRSPQPEEPVYQWLIRRDRPARAKKIATLAYSEKFIAH